MKFKLNRSKAFRDAQGFSLIELMIAMVAGLIVIGAVLTFTVAGVKSNSDYIRATRLTQELRSNLNFISDELRRAGYDENALNYVSRPTSYTQRSPFGPLMIVNPVADNGCIVFAYDRAPGSAGELELGNAEVRAMRRVVVTVAGRSVGVLEFAESAAGLTPNCTAAGPDYTTYPATANATTGWSAFTDPRVIDIQSFRLDNSGFVALPGAGPISPMQIRRVGVALTGALIGDADVVRGVSANVRVRADCIRPNVGTTCVATPS